MNTNNVKKYAPKARKAFIEAMSKQAAKYGITKKNIEWAEQKGDVVLIGDRPFPASVINPRERLVKRIEQQGFDQVIEQVAYSWFNRLCALRYMELKDYLEHGRRVLSSPNQIASFQILEDCLDIELAGLDQTKVRELKLDGTQDELLYRELLLAQCHALHKAMPFLFEAVDDETELLLPENLTKTDSLIHELVNEIPEEDWKSVEIIGWLYQSYISEKKDEVIGKVVKTEDIPAATQLFTPNWIVKYMVQNSLGAQWLATYPESPLKAQMEYYIKPGQQTEEVDVQLKAITPDTLNPEELTLIDPACGSGHILVEAYDLFKAIYFERGYRQRDIAQLILEKNLYGLDIDPRAAQLTGFALMMKGREDDRRLFDRGIKLNVMAMVDSERFDVNALVGGVDLALYELEANDLIELKNLFENATTFGSLIQVPSKIKEKLPALKKLIEFNSNDIFVANSLNSLVPLFAQARLLAMHYDAVVVNPPYIGSKGMNFLIKKFAADHHPDSKSDLFSCFIERSYALTKPVGFIGVVAPYVWMFISSYETFRKKLIEETSLTSLIQLEYNAFEPACIPVATFTLARHHIPKLMGSYIRLSEFKGHQNQAPKLLEAIKNPLCGWFHAARTDDFKKIPGSPVAYWVAREIIEVFSQNQSLGSTVEAKQGIATADNGRFLRLWHELDFDSIGMDIGSNEAAQESAYSWFPYNKGGIFRKWYGNQEYVIKWKNGGSELKGFPGAVVRNPGYQFKESVSWSDVTSSANAFRWYPAGFLFDSTGHSAFPNSKITKEQLLSLCNNKFVQIAAQILNPTMHFHVGYFNDLPAAFHTNELALKIVQPLMKYSRYDWDAYERSWNFESPPICTEIAGTSTTLANRYDEWIVKNRQTISEIQTLETHNNKLFIEAHGMEQQLTSDVPIEQITLSINPAYRYGGNINEEERWSRFREDTVKELISYIIGCMMGRYTLDEPGLIYAQSGNEGFDPARYQTFKADDDGIIPLTDKEWFSDDAANRLEEFIAVAWDVTHLQENIAFLADNLSPKKGEGSRETIRRYLSDSFFKDHLQTYKKRPIYWLFTSGKQKAFQCLVYLHRYNEGTLARMRTQYVIPLTAKLTAHVSKLEQDKDVSTSTPEIKRLEKEIATLHKQQAELSAFEEKLRHYADQRITLDLDEGVKVNYGKFGDLLAEVKSISGDAAEVVS